MAEPRPPTNRNDVIKTAIICFTICTCSVFGTASNWDDGSEVRTTGINAVGFAGALAAAHKAGWL